MSEVSDDARAPLAPPSRRIPLYVLDPCHFERLAWTKGNQGFGVCPICDRTHLMPATLPLVGGE